MISLIRLKEILDTSFGPPFLPLDLVKTSNVERGVDGSFELSIQVGPRDITINEEGRIIGAGTLTSSVTIAPDITNDNLLVAVMEELKHAVGKFPVWPTDPLHALSVLMEEVGELAKDMNEMIYEPRKGVTREKIRKEAIQCAAMSLRLLRSLEKYEYKPADQHKQEVVES